MPNWCHNTLTIVGPADQIEAFVERAQPTEELAHRAYNSEPSWIWKPDAKPGFADWFRRLRETQPLTFEAFLPVPAGVRDEYEWHCDNWGTKWNAYFDVQPMIAFGSIEADVAASCARRQVPRSSDPLAEPGFSSVRYRFNTAWTPPMPVIAAMAVAFPALAFELAFAEIGMGFAGTIGYANGACAHEIELAVEDVLEPDEMWF